MDHPVDPLGAYPEMMSPGDVARHLDVSAFTLRGWRQAGRGPVYVKLGDGPSAPIRYPREGLRSYLAENTVMPREAVS